MGYAPENTLLSVKKAFELGAKWTEVDVYNVEGELIVIHDDRLERTTNGTGYVQDQSLDYIRSLDAGEGERIPFLKEILDFLNGRIGINIELKGTNTAKSVVDLISEYLNFDEWNIDKFLVSSLDHHELLKAKQLLPEIKIGALTSSIPIGYAEFAEKLDAYSVHLALDVCQ